MTDQTDDEVDMKLPEARKIARISRGALQTVGGTILFAGGVLSTTAGAWSEGEQEKVNCFFEHWIRMLQDGLKEKEETIIEIMARLDLQDEAIAKRVESKEYQSLVKKTFRERSGAESEDKEIYIRNILSNAALTPADWPRADDLICRQPLSERSELGCPPKARCRPIQCGQAGRHWFWLLLPKQKWLGRRAETRQHS